MTNFKTTIKGLDVKVGDKAYIKFKDGVAIFEEVGTINEFSTIDCIEITREDGYVKGIVVDTILDIHLK